MNLREKIEEKLKDIATSIEYPRPDLIVIAVNRDRIMEAAQRIVELGFDHLASVEGVDLPKENAIEVIYHAESYEEELRNTIVELKTRVARDDPKLQSLINVWPNALYLERETWDMLGVVFEGHPELKRLLLPPWWDDIPPLRKDYKVKVEGIIVGTK